jgi:2'-5' RNA ligase
VALDVAILPPREVRDLAIRLNQSLPPSQSKGLTLDAERLPHITLTQQFVRATELESALGQVDEVLRSQRPLGLRVTGGGTAGSSVWLAVGRAAPLLDLHERLMDALHAFEQQMGSRAAFYEQDARPRDVLWVSTYRAKASFLGFTPHITLGHASRPPTVDAFSFTATTVAACQLGRFCTCRRVLRRWRLGEST